MLIRAEAGFQLGMADEAESMINQIRLRAGLGELSGITLQQIYNERRWEMAMEHERWFDLVRTGQAQSAMAADGKTFIPEFMKCSQYRTTNCSKRRKVNPKQWILIILILT